MSEEIFLINKENSIILKKSITKILYENNLEQSKIADILKISQPMVSIYYKSKNKIPKEIENIAKNISDKILDNQRCSFKACITFSDNIHENRYYLATKNEVLINENKKIIDNLTQAFINLKGKNLGKILPKVKVNIVLSKENPKNSEDIASFQNGLIISDEKIVGFNGISFGKSKHLSSLILDLKNKINVNSIMNIAYLSDFNKLGFSVGNLSKNFKLKGDNCKFDILLHKGDFGIEPCAYILGDDAVDVSNKVLKIIDGIGNEK